MHASNTPTSNLPEFSGTIEINRSRSSSLADARIDGVVRKIVGDAGFTGGSISIAIVDDPAIHRLNRQYLQHDYPTDVLSFLLAADEATGHLEAEIIVSQDTAMRVARQYGWSDAEELLLYLIHGSLHLTGLDDATDTQRAAMQQAEDRYLKWAGIIRPAATATESALPADTSPP